MRKKIGEVLLESGLITSEQLENALTLQKGKNKRLGKVIISLGYVTDIQVAEALSKQLSLPHVDCDNITITKELLLLVPKETAEKKIILPVKMKGKKLLIAMADPLDWQTIDDIAFSTGLKISAAIASEISILNAIEKYYGSEEKTWDLLKEIPSYDDVEFITGEVKEEEKKEINVQSLYKLSEAPPIVKLVTMVLVDAVRSRASDIHIEPMEKHVQVRYRIDGELRNTLKYPKHIQDSVISRVKIISNLDITNRRLPQDGRSTLQLENKSIDLRISTLPSIYGENIVIRLLDHSTGLVPLSSLGISERVLKPLIKIFTQPQGMILVTGPTGSGKTTTLYAILHQMQSETENIITIEDPVEYKLQGITQVGVNDAIGLSFSNALRSILRQDPDIIMVGEIRDLETAEIAVRSALTGHLILSTLHTNNTIATITRLRDMGLEPFLITSAVSGILAQRLIRKICSKCKVETEPPEELTQRLPPLETYYKGIGCKECQFTGYKGRIGVYEFLYVDTHLKRLIARNATEDELWDAVKKSGIVTLFEDAWAKVKEGITTVDEIISKIPYDEHLGAEKTMLEEERKTKVLIFNAPETDSNFIRKTLESEDYEVVNVVGGDILETTRRENPNLILLNNSKEIFISLKKLRSDIRFIYLPVIALSDSIDKADNAEGIKHGIKEFICRPIEPEKLLFVINQTLKGF